MTECEAIVEGFRTYEDGLRFVLRRMREIAVTQGPQHSFWDAIFDIEAFLAGRPTIIQHTAKEWLELAAEYLGTEVLWGEMSN